MKPSNQWALVVIFQGNDLSSPRRSQLVPVSVVGGVAEAARREGNMAFVTEGTLLMGDDEDESRHLEQFKTFPGFAPAT